MAFNNAILYSDNAVFSKGLTIDPGATVSFGGATLRDVGEPNVSGDAVSLGFLNQKINSLVGGATGAINFLNTYPMYIQAQPYIISNRIVGNVTDYQRITLTTASNPLNVAIENNLILANTLQVGSSFKMSITGTYTTGGNNIYEGIRLLGGVNGDTVLGLNTPHCIHGSSTPNNWRVEGDYTVTSLGATGNLCGSYNFW